MSASSPVQTIVKGKYEVLLDQEIGRGGIAAVLKGNDVATGQMVAIKRLHSQFRTRPDALRRFKNEARMTSFVSHPNIVGYLNYDESGPWLVLEYIDGRDLKTLLAAGALAPAQAVGYVSQLADALDHLHAVQVAHLDIKPQNALVDARGTVKLIDLGLAQEFANQQDLVGDHIFGTAAYLAPEQVRGQPVGGATDTYSLGCVFHEMIVGSPPFSAPGLSGEAEQQALIDQHLYAEHVPPSVCRPDLQIPKWVDDLVATAMQKRPEDRFPSAGAFARAATRGLSPGSTSGRVTGNPRHTFVEPTRTVPASSAEPSAPTAGNDAGRPHDRVGIVRRTWETGGRRLRQSSRATGMLWRLVMLVAIVTVVTGANVVSDGSASQLVSLAMRVAPDLTASVTTDGLNVRSEPQLAAPVVAMVSTGDDVVVTGPPADGADLEWWPVRIGSGEQSVEGWVWAEGVDSSVWMNLLAAPDAVGDGAANVIGGVGEGADTVASWWP